ncbi:tyrosine-type recombinase/integrase [Aquirhabdus sp.]|uniref:tyrosine-type recombinase/integrase n=1 Tax=Aquirhabdus sp. TaxID=2824160 RepID=UPI00396C76B1
MLTPVFLNSLKPQKKLKRYYDTGRGGIAGMYVEVTPTLKMTFRLKYRHEGKDKVFKLGKYPEITIAEARLRCASPKRMIADGIDPNAAKKQSEAAKAAESSIPTLAEAMDEYMLKAAPLLKSCRTIGIRLAKIKRENPEMCNKPIPDVDQSDLIGYRDRRMELGLKGATVKKELQNISSVFRYAKEEMLVIRHNPVLDINKPKDSPPRHRRISNEEVAIFCTAANFDKNITPRINKQYAAWCFMFAIETAMRASEITEMKWSNLFTDHIHLPDTKNGKKRDVPLSPLALHLVELMRGVDDTYIIPIPSNSLDTVFREVRDSSALKGTDLHFHDSRHEACTRLAQVLEFHDLAKVSGHTDLRVLHKVYYNVTGSELAAKMRQGKQRLDELKRFDVA